MILLAEQFCSESFVQVSGAQEEAGGAGAHHRLLCRLLAPAVVAGQPALREVGGAEVEAVGASLAGGRAGGGGRRCGGRRDGWNSGGIHDVTAVLGAAGEQGMVSGWQG